MTTQTTLRPHLTLRERVANLRERLVAAPWLVSLAALYSDLIEEPVSPMRALRLTHACCVVTLCLMVSSNSLLVFFLFLAWAFLACYHARS